MKKSLLVKLHLYFGLFTIFYLVAFGLSSIIMNHKIDVENKDITESWEGMVKVDPDLSNGDLATSVIEQLDLMGWNLYWKSKRDSVNFQFVMAHPGRNYHVNLDLKNGHVQVGEAPRGFLAVFHELHVFRGNVPNGPLFLRTWAVYQWLTLFSMLISLTLGLWLWLKFSYQKWEGLVFGGLLIGTLLIMLMI